ncbi:MAG: hypothetical protein K6F64_04405 [Clostridia bacterium]|nr:hypothetical protein [Clostridia bacterium]
MKELLLCAVVIGMFTTGYLLTRKLDAFLEINSGPVENDSNKEYPDCVFLNEELSDEELIAEVKKFRKTHKDTEIILCDSGRIIWEGSQNRGR